MQQLLEMINQKTYKVGKWIKENKFCDVTKKGF